MKVNAAACASCIVPVAHAATAAAVIQIFPLSINARCRIKARCTCDWERTKMRRALD
jgi:hypothetical protein